MFWYAHPLKNYQKYVVFFNFLILIFFMFQLNNVAHVGTSVLFDNETYLVFKALCNPKKEGK